MDLLYLQLRSAGDVRVLPLVMDIANPTPGVGWGLEDYRSLIDRCNADVILALTELGARDKVESAAGDVAWRVRHAVARTLSRHPDAAGMEVEGSAHADEDAKELFYARNFVELIGSRAA